MTTDKECVDALIARCSKIEDRLDGDRDLIAMLGGLLREQGKQIDCLVSVSRTTSASIERLAGLIVDVAKREAE